MKRLILLLIFFASSVSAQEQARMFSGEHSEFTRLVILLPEDQVWALEEQANAYRITLEGWEAGFDATHVFSRIDRGRIADVATTASDVTLSLACRCLAQASELPGGGIIVDVREKPQASREPLDPVDWKETTSAPLPLRIPQEEPRKDVATRRDAFRDSLLSELTRAGRSSLLDLALDTIDTEQINVGEEADRPGVEDRLVVTDPRLERPSEPRPAPLLSAATCPAEEHFDIASWGGKDEFGDQLGVIRAGMIGEFDVIDVDKLRALIRFYLYHDLVPEAELAMQVFELDPKSSKYLQLIGDLVQLKSPRDAPDLHACEGALAIWALLTNPRTYLLSQDRIASISASFSQWPPHLREKIGPELVGIVTARGFTTAASVLQAQIDPQLALETLPTKSFEEASQDELLAIVNEAGDAAPLALAHYLERAIEQKEHVSDAMLELAAAFETENGDLPISDRLNIARTYSYAISGRFEDVRAQLDQRHANADGLPEDMPAKLLAFFADGESHAALASMALYLNEYGRLNGLPEDLATQVAEQLLASGLPELSQILLAASATDTQDQFLKARVQASDFNFEDAIAALDQSLSSEAGSMRAKLMMQSGQAQQAWLRDAGDLEEPLRNELAWAAGQWQEMTGPGLRAEVAQILAATPRPPENSETPISDARALSRTSAQTRAMVSELLSSNAQQ